MVTLMPGDLLLYVAVSGHEFDGKPLEGVGVAPDHLVEQPLAYAAGADPVLDAAIDLLLRQEPR
jgi:carboxyl-terminal processing protease